MGKKVSLYDWKEMAIALLYIIANSKLYLLVFENETVD